MALVYDSMIASGESIPIVDKSLEDSVTGLSSSYLIHFDEIDPVTQSELYEICFFGTKVKTLSTLNYHLLDANADGEVTIEDAFALLLCDVEYSVGNSPYFAEGRYDLFRAAYTVSYNAEGTGCSIQLNQYPQQ